jgi:cobalt-zinc-cadmium resistance protein CzcA
MRVLHKALRARSSTLAIKRPSGALALVRARPRSLCVVLFPLLGGEFMPKLEEGNFWIRATLPTSISLDQSAKYVGQDAPHPARLPRRPEGRVHGREPLRARQDRRDGRLAARPPDDGTDVSQFNNIEFFAPLKQFDEWPHGVTKEKLTDEMSKKLTTAFPASSSTSRSTSRQRRRGALSGVKGENSVKVLGPDLETRTRRSPTRSSTSCRRRRGEGSRHVSSRSGSRREDHPRPRARARATGSTRATSRRSSRRRRRAGRHAGLRGEKHFDLTVRWLEPYRKSIEAIREITVATPDGQHPARPAREIVTRGGAERHLPRGRHALRRR